MRQVLFIFFIVLTNKAYAESGFYNIPQNNSELSKSIYKLSSYNGTCSGVFISQDGHFLTASHCIKSCLESESLIETQKETYPRFYINKIKENTRKDLVCKGYSINELSLGNPQVVYLGSGYSGFDEAYYPYYSSNTKELFQTYSGDYAILKFDIQRVPCLSVSKQSLRRDEKVFIIGYPGKTIRDNGKGSDGMSRYMTRGFVRNDISRNGYVQSLRFLEDERLTAQILVGDLERFYIRSGYLILDNDIYPGMSGGPLVDEKNQIRGIIFGAIGSSEKELQNHYVQNSAFGIDIAEVIRSVGADLNSEEIKKIFSCGQENE